jgi:hypothetical protein
MLHAGLDLSRARLDVHAVDETGAPVAVMTAAPMREDSPRWPIGWLGTGSR